MKNLFRKNFKINCKEWIQKNIKLILFIIFLIIFLIFIVIYMNMNLKKVESFSTIPRTSEKNNINDTNSGSYIPMKHPILTDCLNNYGITDESIKCNQSAWVTNPKMLCGICDIVRGGEVNYFTKNDVKYYGCNQNASNNVDIPSVTWVPPTNTDITINKVSGYFKDRLTCNYFNQDKKSDLYLMAICDDILEIKINNKKILNNSDTNNSNWNKLYLLYVPNVKSNDTIYVRGINMCGPGGINISYIWNKQLYILGNNGFDGYANIISYNIDKSFGWTTLWEQYVPQLPPWMKNYIRIENSPSCSADKLNQRDININFDVGNSVNDGNLKTGITCFISCDVKNMQLLLNDNIIYTKITDTNILDTIRLDNVNEGDMFTINFNRILGGNIILMMLWGGLIYTFDGGFNPGDNGMATFRSETINTFTLLDSKGNPFHGSVSYNNDLPDSLQKLAIIKKWTTVSDNFSIKMKMPDSSIDPLSFFRESSLPSSEIDPDSNRAMGSKYIQNILADAIEPNKPREYFLISDSYNFNNITPITTYKSQQTDKKLIIEECQKKCDNIKNCDAFTLNTNTCKFYSMPPEKTTIQSIWGFFGYIFFLWIYQKDTGCYIAKKKYTQKSNINYVRKDFESFNTTKESCKILCDLLPECYGYTINKKNNPNDNPKINMPCTILNSISGNGVNDENIDSYIVD